MSAHYHFSGVSLTGEAEAYGDAHEEYLTTFGECPSGLVNPTGGLYAYTQGTLPANHPEWPNSGYHVVEIEPSLYSPTQVADADKGIVGIGCTTGEAVKDFERESQKANHGITSCPVCFSVDVDNLCLVPPGQIDPQHQYAGSYDGQWQTLAKYSLTFDWVIERRKFRVPIACTEWPDCNVTGDHLGDGGNTDCNFVMTENWTQQSSGSENIQMLPTMTADSSPTPAFSGNVASWNQLIVLNKPHALLETSADDMGDACSGTYGNGWGTSLINYWTLKIETDYIPAITNQIGQGFVTMNPWQTYPFFIYNSGILNNEAQVRYGIAQDIYKDIEEVCVGPEDTGWKGNLGGFPDRYCDDEMFGNAATQGPGWPGLQYCNHGCYDLDVATEPYPSNYNSGSQWRVKVSNPVIEKIAGFDPIDQWRYKMSGTKEPVGFCDTYKYYHFYSCDFVASSIPGNLNECQLIEALEPAPESGLRIKIPKSEAPWSPEQGTDNNCTPASTDPDPNDNCTVSNYGSGVTVGYASMDFGLDCGILIERIDDSGEWQDVSTLNWMGCWSGSTFTLVSGCDDCPTLGPAQPTVPWPPLGTPLSGECESWNSGTL